MYLLTAERDSRARKPELPPCFREAAQFDDLHKRPQAAELVHEHLLERTAFVPHLAPLIPAHAGIQKATENRTLRAGPPLEPVLGPAKGRSRVRGRAGDSG